MRPIKFRALTFKDEFVYGYYVTDDKEYHAIVYPNPDDESEMINMHVNGATVGQFTGLTDKNGADIYEGGILGETRLLHNGPCYCAVEVKYIAPSFKVRDLPLASYMGIEWEAIGNIHQSPGLLEQK